MTTEEKGIHLFFKGLNLKLQVLSIRITSIGKFFDEVTDFVKKVEGVRRDGPAKALAKKHKSKVTFMVPTLYVQVVQNLQPDHYSHPCSLLQLVTRELHNRTLFKMVKESYLYLAADRLLTVVFTIVKNIVYEERFSP